MSFFLFSGSMMVYYSFVSMLIKKFFQLLNEVIANNLPDVHFTVGDVPYIRSPLGNLQRVLDF